MKDVLVSLRKVKQEMTVETIPKADIWCHFGNITIQIPDRGSVSLCFAVNCQLTSPSLITLRSLFYLMFTLSRDLSVNP